MRVLTVFIMLAMVAGMNALVQRTLTGTVHGATERPSNHQVQAAGAGALHCVCRLQRAAACCRILYLQVGCEWVVLAWHSQTHHNWLPFAQWPIKTMAGLGICGPARQTRWSALGNKAFAHK